MKKDIEQASVAPETEAQIDNSRSTRRDFTRGMLGFGLLGITGANHPTCDVTGDEGEDGDTTPDDHSSAPAYDFVIVGSGAGGGPLAANLARNGFTVAVLEAGIDPLSDEAQRVDPTAAPIYQTPAFWGAASEHALLSWDFYVKHYSDPARQALDSKYVEGKGILYPRGSTLGGSTAHNAMVFIYPHDEDFDQIARETGDRSWESSNMRTYFIRLERCEYLERGAPGHGFDGYFNSSLLDPQVFDLCPPLHDLAFAGADPLSAHPENPEADVNHPSVARGATGTFRVPMHTAGKVRVSVREHLRATQEQFPDRLFLITGALATKINIRGRRAVGVEYMRGQNLYRADKHFNEAEVAPRSRVRAIREVIVAGGAFNTPQLLKLSGIGPKRELRRHGIPVVVNLPGVGENLQDRYEVTVSAELKTDLSVYTQCAPFQPADPCLDAYQTGTWTSPTPAPFFGPYANNLGVGGRIARSSDAQPLPDLFFGGLPVPFLGYEPGYSQVPLGRHFSWLVLRAHNKNTAGQVLLRSRDPRDTPDINFHSFDEGNDSSGQDLEAMVTGVKRARSFLEDPIARQHVLTEVSPGASVQTDDQLREFIKNEAWGHHASCTAKIGADSDPMAVLDSRFRVRGVRGLRVVDACVFPRTPGFFPVAAVLMISEKASDVIIAEARGWPGEWTEETG
ncbi:GMC oxidoreductase [Sorangium sp. So ce295]|uniref:GMC family oxidoreductase n=1 Tax=Sorangium sp. So ce295 TaxID=3133295 RepID=UPI003F610FF9